MALQNQDLLRSTTRNPPIRMYAYPNGSQVGTFLNVAGAPIYAPGTPMTLNSSGKWVVWTNGQLVEGFVYFQNEGAYPDHGVATHATDDVQGVVLVRGQIHYGDVVLPSGELQANLDAALKSGPRELGLDIQGLAGAGQHLTDPDT